MYDLDQILGQRPQRKRNGQFAKGHTPFCKGKKWNEWLSPEMQEKVRSCLRRTGRPDIAGWNKQPVIASKEGQELWFESSEAAAKALGVFGTNIRKCLKGQRHTAGGWRFRRSSVIQH